MQSSPSERSPSTVLIAVGALLLTFLVVWVGHTIVRGPVDNVMSISGEKPVLLLSGSGFSGDNNLPKEKMDAALEQAHQRVIQRVETGNSRALAARVTEWVSFGLSAFITLMAGYLGRIPRGNATETAEELLKENEQNNKARKSKSTADGTRDKKDSKGAKGPKSRRWFAAIIGIAAALSSMTLAISTRLQASAQSHRQSAVELHGKIVTSRKDLMNAKNSDEAQQILDELAVQARLE